jgi:hypothetical protein
MDISLHESSRKPYCLGGKKNKRRDQGKGNATEGDLNLCADVSGLFIIIFKSSGFSETAAR